MAQRACRLGQVWWYSDDCDYSHTEMPDGTRAIARPEDTDAYCATAMDLGYGTDTARLSREHDYCHSLLAYLAHLADSSLPVISPALWDAAHGYTGGEDRHGDEERRVLAFQAYLNRWRHVALEQRTGPYYQTLREIDLPAGMTLTSARNFALAILRGPGDLPVDVGMAISFWVRQSIGVVA